MPNDKESAAAIPQLIKWKYQAGQKKDDVPWGPHKLPLAMELEGVSLSVEEQEGGFLYKREGLGENIRKIVLTGKANLILSPVEPFHHPAGVSTHLLVELAQPVEIEPRTTRELMVTFPLDLACAIERRRSGAHVLDTFTFCKPKHTLYGSIKDGMVCKYWKSEVYHLLPAVNPLVEGVMVIAVQNPGNRWAELHRAVFSAHGMKVYYNRHLASLKATMRINNEITAETKFLDEPLQAGMKKALEQFTTRLLSQPGRTVMEEGY